jgi:hypothetical protein
LPDSEPEKGKWRRECFSVTGVCPDPVGVLFSL